MSALSSGKMRANHNSRVWSRLISDALGDCPEELRNPSLLEARFGGNHLLVQYAQDQHSVWLRHIKHYMFTTFKPAQAGMN